MKKRGFESISASGGLKSFANVDVVKTIEIQDQEKNLPPFKEKVHLWNTILVS